MSDLKILIDKILSEFTQKSRKNHQETVYRDEPIIRRASQMRNYLPEKIAEMKKLASEPGAYYQTEAYIFFRQAKFMEDYEDDFEYSGTFLSYFPTYQKMTNDQLRGYFSWRSRVRKGEYTETSLSFIYVYIYELLNGAGYKTPEEGYEKLRAFCDAYAEMYPQITRYTDVWLWDYVVYYGLDKALLGEAGKDEISFYKALSAIKSYGTVSDGELFDALCTAASYDMRNSRLYKKMTEDTVALTCQIFRSVADYYEKNRTKSLFEKLFGVEAEIRYEMFYSAVFYDSRKYTDYVYEIDDLQKFYCRNGRWSCKKYYTNRKNKWLGDFLRSADSILRQRLDFGYPVNCPLDTKWLIAVINKETDIFLENKKKNAAVKIEIDVSKLAGIRKSADITRDRLMTDDEREDTPEETADITAVCEVSETENNSGKAENDTPLSDEEYRFMRKLLYGESFTGKTMFSVLADSVNEKLFDMFGDVVIEFDGDKPVVIEDYENDLKGMIPE